jgi:hypothetical protein
MHYAKDVSRVLTELYVYETPEAKDVHEPGNDPQKVAIRSSRPDSPLFTPDKLGFSLHNFKCNFDNETWEDEDLVRTQFYSEVVMLLQKALGCSRVLVFDHTIRKPPP